MPSRSAIRRLATHAALAATVVSLVASAPAAADTDQYGNRLEFLDAQFQPVPCNPSYVGLAIVALSGRDFMFPLFRNAVAWVDYFGIPVFVSPPFGATTGNLPVPGPSEIPPGQYSLHVLLQGNAPFPSSLFFVFTTVSDTSIIAPGLNPDCTPTSTATAASAGRAVTRKPARSVLARRVKAMRRDSGEWFERSVGPRANYPKARFCGQTICVQRRAGAAWKPVARR
jgi:hypothetical protein